MQINDAPVTAYELAPTIVSQIEDTRTDGYGDTFFEITQGERTRMIYQYIEIPVKDPDTSCHDGFLRLEYTGHVSEVALHLDDSRSRMMHIGNCLYDQSDELIVNYDRNIKFVI